MKSVYFEVILQCLQGDTHFCYWKLGTRVSFTSPTIEDVSCLPLELEEIQGPLLLGDPLESKGSLYDLHPTKIKSFINSPLLFVADEM